MYRSLAVAATLICWNSAAEAQTRQPVIPEAIFEHQGPFVVTDISWIDHPNPEFPSVASAQCLTDGIVDLVCIVTVEGRATDCEVMEDRPGFGFGPAALASLATARLSPRTVNGLPVEGAFRFQVRFLLCEETSE